MEIKQLITALAIAKHLSFAKAGLETSFSTSAISKQIKSLEQELGVCLFARKGKSRIHLTPEGEVLLPYFGRIVDEHNSILQQVGTFVINKNAQLTIASPKIFPLNIESELMGEYIKNNPDVSLNVTHHFLNQMIDMLYIGKVDLGMTTILGKLEENPILYRLANDNNFVAIPVMVRDDFVMMHPSNPLCGKSEVSIEDLTKYPDLCFLFVNSYPEKPSIRKAIFLRECDKFGHKPKIIDFNYDNGVSSIMAKYVELNHNAVAIIPDLDIDYLQTARVKLKSDAYSPTTIIFYLKSNRSKALRAFVASAKNVSRKYFRHNRLNCGP